MRPGQFLGDIEAVKKRGKAVVSAFVKSTTAEIFELKGETLRTEMGRTILERLSEGIEEKMRLFNLRANKQANKQKKSKYREMFVDNYCAKPVQIVNLRKNPKKTRKLLSTPQKIVNISIKSASKIPWSTEEKTVMRQMRQRIKTKFNFSQVN